MHQDSDATEQGRRGQRAARRLGPILKLGRPTPEDQHQKPGRDRESRHSRLDQQLQIIIVRLVDKEQTVETAKFRVDDGERAESPTQQWPLRKHAQAVAIDAEANPAIDFFTSFGVNAG